VYLDPISIDRAAVRCTDSPLRNNFTLSIFCICILAVITRWMLPSKFGISTVSAPMRPTHATFYDRLRLSVPCSVSERAPSANANISGRSHQMSHHSPQRRLFVCGFCTAENTLRLVLVPRSPFPLITNSAHLHPPLSSVDDNE
jgi:hypothetical protein